MKTRLKRVKSWLVWHLDWHLKLNWVLLRELPQFDGTMEVWFNTVTSETRRVLC